MARRSDHSSEEIVSMTIAWVKEYLSHSSVAELSLRKIAKAIGYSPGTLINQFGSYSLLLLQVNAATMDQLSEQMSKTVKDTDAPIDQLNGMAQAYLKFAEQNCHAWRLIFEHRLEEQEDIPEWQMDRIGQFLDRVKTPLQAIKKSANEQDIEEAARVIWGGVHGICALAVEDKLFTPTGITSNQLILSLINNYVNGWQANV